MTKIEKALAKLASLPPEAKLEEALTRLAELPPEDQDAIAEMILDYGQDDFELTPEQLEELDRRLADPNPKFLTSDEVRERLKRFGV